MKAYGKKPDVENFVKKLDTLFVNVKASNLIANDHSFGVHVFVELNPELIRKIPIDCPLMKKEH